MSYTVRKEIPGAVWIVDNDDGRSVTNDAERVVAELVARFGNRRFFYRDTIGRWDELKHDGRAFVGFAPSPRWAQRAGAVAWRQGMAQ